MKLALKIRKVSLMLTLTLLAATLLSSGCVTKTNQSTLSIRNESNLNTLYRNTLFKRDKFRKLNGKSFSVKVIFENQPDYIFQDPLPFNSQKFKYPGNIVSDIRSAFSFVGMEYGGMRYVRDNADINFIFTINQLFDLVVKHRYDETGFEKDWELNKKALIDSDIDINGYKVKYQCIMADESQGLIEADLKTVGTGVSAVMSKYIGDQLVMMETNYINTDMHGQDMRFDIKVLDPETGKVIINTSGYKNKKGYHGKKNLMEESTKDLTFEERMLIGSYADHQFKRLVFMMFEKALLEARNVI